jgi:hypothetical protein
MPQCTHTHHNNKNMPWQSEKKDCLKKGGVQSLCYIEWISCSNLMYSKETIVNNIINTILYTWNLLKELSILIQKRLTMW